MPTISSAHSLADGGHGAKCAFAHPTFAVFIAGRVCYLPRRGAVFRAGGAGASAMLSTSANISRTPHLPALPSKAGMGRIADVRLVPTVLFWQTRAGAAIHEPNLALIDSAQ